MRINQIPTTTPSQHAGPSSAWIFLFAGLAIGSIAMHALVTRPLVAQMSLLQKQVQGLNRDIALMAGLRDQWTVSTDLASALAQSREEIEEGWRALDAIRTLRADLDEEARRCASARESVKELADLREQVASVRGMAFAQAASLAVVQRATDKLHDASIELSREACVLDSARRQLEAVRNFHDHVARQSWGIEKARRTVDDLTQIKNDILRSSHDMEFTRRRADAMIDLVGRLRDDKANALPALVNLTQMEKLLDRLVSDKSRITGAIETADLLQAFEKEMSAEARKISEIRSALRDIEPIAESTRRLIEALGPMAGLHDLRELDDAELRTAARAILDRRAGLESTLQPVSDQSAE